MTAQSIERIPKVFGSRAMKSPTVGVVSRHGNPDNIAQSTEERARDNRKTRDDHRSPSSPSVSSPTTTTLPSPPNHHICRTTPSRRCRRSQSDLCQGKTYFRATTARRFPLRIEVVQARHVNDRRVRGLIGHDAGARLGLSIVATLGLSAVGFRRDGVQIREVEAVGNRFPVSGIVGTAGERSGNWDDDVSSRWTTTL
jgi:hypothetical protein